MKLADKMYQYEMDPTSAVTDAEQTIFSPQMDKVKTIKMDLTRIVEDTKSLMLPMDGET